MMTTDRTGKAISVLMLSGRWANPTFPTLSMLTHSFRAFSILKKGISSPSPEIIAWMSVELEPSPNLRSQTNRATVLLSPRQDWRTLTFSICGNKRSHAQLKILWSQGPARSRKKRIRHALLFCSIWILSHSARVSVILNILTRLLRLAPELDQIVEALAQVWLNSLAMYHSP